MPRKPRDPENYLTPKKAAAYIRQYARDLLRNADIDVGDLIRIKIQLRVWNPERWERQKRAKKS